MPESFLFWTIKKLQQNSFEEDIAVSFESLVSQKPSKEIIECLTDVTVEAVDYNAFYQIRGQYPQLMEYVILITELYVIWLEDRIFDFHARSATDRYLNLLKNIRNTFIISSLPIFHLTQEFLWKHSAGSERKYKSDRYLIKPHINKGLML